MKRPRKRPSGALAQADLDKLTKRDLLALLKADATREDLLGLWLGIDWSKNRRPGQEHAVEPHPPERLEGVDGIVLDLRDVGEHSRTGDV